MQTQRRRLFWPTLTTILGALLLVGLGTWQLERKAWKDDLIARIGKSAQSEPIVLDAAATLFRAGDEIEYTRVRARGRFLPERSRFLWAPGKSGPGYHVYTPLETPSGAILMVNRGFLPEAAINGLQAGGGDRGAAVEVVGLLRKPAKKATFEATNDVAKNRWYWRDIDGMTRSAFPEGGREFFPFFIDAEAAPAGAGHLTRGPQGGVTRLQLPNRHLEYALTWYGLAVAMIGVYFAFLRTRRERKSPLLSGRRKLIG